MSPTVSVHEQKHGGIDESFLRLPRPPTRLSTTNYLLFPLVCAKIVPVVSIQKHVVLVRSLDFVQEQEMIFFLSMQRDCLACFYAKSRFFFVS